MKTNPFMKQTSPSAFELRTAIAVLNMLDERIRIETAYSMTQLPKTELGNQYAANVEGRALEQSFHINTVCAQLENWDEETVTTRTSPTSSANCAKLPSLVTSAKRLWLSTKCFVTSKLSPQENRIGRMVPKSQH